MLTLGGDLGHRILPLWMHGLLIHQPAEEGPQRAERCMSTSRIMGIREREKAPLQFPTTTTCQRVVVKLHASLEAWDVPSDSTVYHSYWLLAARPRHSTVATFPEAMPFAVPITWKAELSMA
jgi:hypothetical protein